VRKQIFNAGHDEIGKKYSGFANPIEKKKFNPHLMYMYKYVSVGKVAFI